MSVYSRDVEEEAEAGSGNGGSGGSYTKNSKFLPRMNLEGNPPGLRTN